MTNPTPHGQVPEALRLAQELDAVPETGADPQTIQEAAAELRRLHAYCQELESHLILDCMTHVQNPAENEHVAGDVSKNGAESNMSTQQPAPAPRQEAQEPVVHPRHPAAVEWPSDSEIDALVTSIGPTEGIRKANQLTIAGGTPWTKKQQAAIAQANSILEAAGIWSRRGWTTAQAYDVAQAGVDAVTKWASKPYNAEAKGPRSGPA